jgi:lactate dehydrogenase-like 2-hydroxyacid dehydrogenase
MSRSVADCTVLVVGLGAVGRAVVARLRPFGPRIVAVRAHPERGVVAGVEQVVGTRDLVGAVGQADVVIRAAVLDADSRGLFDARVFRSFKPGAVSSTSPVAGWSRSQRSSTRWSRARCPVLDWTSTRPNPLTPTAAC